MNIRTERVCKKFRGLEEWIAWDDDTDDEAEIGRGHSRQEAVDDLCEIHGLPYSMKVEDAA